MITNKYLYNSFKSLYNNPSLIKYVGSFKQKLLTSAIRKSDRMPLNSTTVYMNFTKAYKTGQLNEITFDTLYYYLRFIIDVPAYITIKKHPDCKYVLSIALRPEVPHNYKEQIISMLYVIVSKVVPSIKHCISVGYSIGNLSDCVFREPPYTTTDLARDFINPTEDMKIITTRRMIREFSTLVVKPDDKSEAFGLPTLHTYRFRAFGVTILAVTAFGAGLYIQSMDITSKHALQTMLLTADFINEDLYRMMALVFA